MSAALIARRHLELALEEAEAEGCSPEAVGRHMIDAVVTHSLKTRSVEDVRRELQFIVDTIDPDTDFIFMRP